MWSAVTFNGLNCTWSAVTRTDEFYRLNNNCCLQMLSFWAKLKFYHEVTLQLWPNNPVNSNDPLEFIFLNVNIYIDLLLYFKKSALTVGETRYSINMLPNFPNYIGSLQI